MWEALGVGLYCTERKSFREIKKEKVTSLIQNSIVMVTWGRTGFDCY